MSAPAALPAPIFDPYAGYSEPRMLADAAKAGDWRAVDAGFARLTDPDVRHHAIGKVANAAERYFLEDVAAAEPTSVLAGTLLASRLITDGWDIRTGSWGKDVSREQWKAFSEHLHRAEQTLIEVTARDPGQATAWKLRLDIARGLSLGQAEARRRYDHVAPHFLPAQEAMVQQLCPKWSGSYEAMHGFAVECVKASPPGSPNGVAVALAHIEHWLLIDRDEGGPAAAAYLARHDVQGELRWAAEHSVFNPAARPSPGWVTGHSAFAMAFSLAENHAAAAAHFNALLRAGNYADDDSWRYLGDEHAEFVAHRRRAFQRGFSR
ncbi:hypothetical protein [Asanoa siamensis]|uniref:hypothetical protein n=1 Tax=Asanoa siamensis TaxID=926357 RepID=UPI001941544A|nr:hypothetical protein [Asanoa siamensis]